MQEEGLEVCKEKGEGFQGRWVSCNTSRRLSGVRARGRRGRRCRNLSRRGPCAPSGLFARQELEAALARIPKSPGP